MIAIAFLQRRHRRRVDLGHDRLRLGQGCWDAGDPLAARVGELLEILFAVEGTIGHEIRRAIGDVQLLQMVADDLPKVARITAIATERFHQQRNASLMFHHQVQHDLVEVRAMIAAIAAGDVNDVGLRAPPHYYSGHRRGSWCYRDGKGRGKPKRWAAVAAMRL